MGKVSIKIKLCVIIILSLVIGFVILNTVSVKLMKQEVFNQIKADGEDLADAIALEIKHKLEGEDKINEIQNLVEEVNGEGRYNYVVYMEANEKGEVVALAHSNHDRINIVLDDAGSVAAAKEGKAYCDYYTDPTSGLRTLDTLCPVYNDDGDLQGAFNIGIPVDQKTLSSLTQNAVIKLTIIATIIAFVVAVLLIIVFNVLIGKPIGDLVNVLNQLTDGSLSVKYKAGKLNTRDELDYLSNDVNKLIDKLHDIVIATQKYSSRLKDNAEHFTEVVEATNEGVNNISLAMGDVAQGATSQAENTSQAMNKIQELSQTLEMIIGKIAELNKAAGEMKELSQSSKVALGELVKANGDTKNSINDIVSQSNETLKAVEEIDSIIRTIDEISSQTNLLSLNASIEAARAGEAGRGFAVVATEIGALAQNSADSAKQIGIIIEKVKDMIKKSADLSSLLDTSSENQMDKLHATENSIGSVMDSVDTIAQNTEHINTEVANLDKIKVDIGDTIENLSAISEENAASAEQTAASTSLMQTNVEQIEESTKEIKQIADDLDKTINYFH